MCKTTLKVIFKKDRKIYFYWGFLWINVAFSFQRDKVKSLVDTIGDTRTGVTDVKTFIDGMRTSRDTKMQEMTNLKNKLKDQVCTVEGPNSFTDLTDVRAT